MVTSSHAHAPVFFAACAGAGAGAGAGAADAVARSAPVFGPQWVVVELAANFSCLRVAPARWMTSHELEGGVQHVWTTIWFYDTTKIHDWATTRYLAEFNCVMSIGGRSEPGAGGRIVELG